MAEEVQGVNYIGRIPPELIAIVVDYVGLAEPFYIQLGRCEEPWATSVFSGFSERKLLV